MQPERETFLGLADRAETAAGPNYALECAIWDCIYPGERLARFEKLTAQGQPYHGRLGPADIDGYIQPLRAFTASLDAALTLVPEDTFWSITMQGERRGGFSVCCQSSGPLKWHVGATPALAMTVAALRARAAGA